MAKDDKKTDGKDKSDKPKRSIVQYKDLAMAFMMSNVNMDEIRKLNNKTSITKSTHKKAVDVLKESATKFDTTEYEKWVEETFGSTEGRGRTAPSVGESRNYKTQKVEKSGPFIRLPLDSLACGKGDIVKVSFNDGSILVTVHDGSEAEEAASS